MGQGLTGFYKIFDKYFFLGCFNFYSFIYFYRLRSISLGMAAASQTAFFARNKRPRFDQVGRHEFCSRNL